MTDPYLDFIHKFNESKSIDELSNVLKSYAESLGFEYIAFGAITLSSKQLLLNIHPKYPFISTFPAEWIARYINKNYIAIDPLATTAINNIRPFTWSDLKKSNTLNKKQTNTFNERKEFGLTSGVTIPLHGPNNYSFLISAASSDNDNALCLDRLEKVTTMASEFHCSFITLVTEAQNKLINLDLTQREQECLTWSALGKSAWDISKILNVSEHTVNFHLKNAMKKLDAINKTSAVVKAIQSGLINP